MMYRVPLIVNVAPVQTYAKTVVVEAASRAEAAKLIRQQLRPGNSILSDAINSQGWKPVGGRLTAIRPDRTAYDTYLDERGLDAWVSADPSPSNTNPKAGAPEHG